MVIVVFVGETPREGDCNNLLGSKLNDENVCLPYNGKAISDGSGTFASCIFEPSPHPNLSVVVRPCTAVLAMYLYGDAMTSILVVPLDNRFFLKTVSCDKDSTS